MEANEFAKHLAPSINIPLVFYAPYSIELVHPSHYSIALCKQQQQFVCMLMVITVTPKAEREWSGEIEDKEKGKGQRDAKREGGFGENRRAVG